MNIFVLDHDPWEIPKHYMDIHVNKMLMESCQLLATAVRVTYGTKTDIVSPHTGKKYVVWLLPSETYGFLTHYCIEKGWKEKLVLSTGIPRQTHINHPCAKWAKENWHNFVWLHNLAVELRWEFYKRAGKFHSWDNKPGLLAGYLKIFPNGDLTPWPQVMPDEFKEIHSEVITDDFMGMGKLTRIKDGCPIKAYRRYYAAKIREFRKRGLCKYYKRDFSIK